MNELEPHEAVDLNAMRSGPAISLFSPLQVAVATFLGLPISGAWLLAANSRKLENFRGPHPYVFFGGCATFVLVVASYSIPRTLPGYILALACSAVAYRIAVRIEESKRPALSGRQPQRCSNWAALPIIVVSDIVVFAAIMAFFRFR